MHFCLTISRALELLGTDIQSGTWKEDDRNQIANETALKAREA